MGTSESRCRFFRVGTGDAEKKSGRRVLGSSAWTEVDSRRKSPPCLTDGISSTGLA